MENELSMGIHAFHLQGGCDQLLLQAPTILISQRWTVPWNCELNEPLSHLCCICQAML